MSVVFLLKWNYLQAWNRFKAVVSLKNVTQMSFCIFIDFKLTYYNQHVFKSSGNGVSIGSDELHRFELFMCCTLCTHVPLDAHNQVGDPSSCSEVSRPTSAVNKVTSRVTGLHHTSSRDELSPPALPRICLCVCVNYKKPVSCLFVVV